MFIYPTPFAFASSQTVSAACCGKKSVHGVAESLNESSSSAFVSNNNQQRANGRTFFSTPSQALLDEMNDAGVVPDAIATNAAAVATNRSLPMEGERVSF